MPKKLDSLDAALSTLRKLAAALPGAEEYVMVHHPAFRVGKKPFAIVGMDRAPTVSINLGPEAQADLLTDERFSRTHYIGQHGWVTVDYGRLRAGEVASLVEGSWQRVAGKKHLAAHAGPGALAREEAAPHVQRKKASAAGTARAQSASTKTKKRPAGAKKSPAPAKKKADKKTGAKLA